MLVYKISDVYTLTEEPMSRIELETSFLPKEYSASDNVGECYVLGKLATTFVETKKID